MSVPSGGLLSQLTAGLSGTVSREGVEVATVEMLRRHPEFANKIHGHIGPGTEVALKAGGDVMGKLARYVIIETKNKLGAHSAKLDEIAGFLANLTGDGIDGLINGFAEAARNGKLPASPAAVSSVPAAGAKVIRSRAMSGDAMNHVHVLQGTDPQCLLFCNAKDVWENEHKVTLIQDGNGGGKGGKDRGNPRPSVKLAEAEAFPTQTLTLEQAKAIGYAECPRCQPYAKADKEAAEKEAKMAQTEHDAAGHPAPVKKQTDRNKLEPSELSEAARQYVVSLATAAPREQADLVDDILYVDKSLLETYVARVVRRKGSLGPTDPITPVAIAAMADGFSEADMQDGIRFIFGTGAGHVEKATRFQEFISSFGKKVNPKAAAVAAAEAKLEAARAATNTVGTAHIVSAEAELAEAKQALEPKKTHNWLHWILVGAGILLALYVIWTAITLASL